LQNPEQSAFCGARKVAAILTRTLTKGKDGATPSAAVRPKAATGGARVGEKRSRLEAGIAEAASHVHEAIADEGEAVEEV
jgi:hypothetical protein